MPFLQQLHKISLEEVEVINYMPGKLTDAKINIYLPSKRLRLYSRDQVVKEYPVAIGKANDSVPG